MAKFKAYMSENETNLRRHMKIWNSMSTLCVYSNILSILKEYPRRRFFRPPNDHIRFPRIFLHFPIDHCFYRICDADPLTGTRPGSEVFPAFKRKIRKNTKRRNKQQMREVKSGGNGKRLLKMCKSEQI